MKGQNVIPQGQLNQLCYPQALNLWCLWESVKISKWCMWVRHAWVNMNLKSKVEWKVEKGKGKFWGTTLATKTFSWGLGTF